MIKAVTASHVLGSTWNGYRGSGAVNADSGLSVI